VRGVAAACRAPRVATACTVHSCSFSRLSRALECARGRCDVPPLSSRDWFNLRGGAMRWPGDVSFESAASGALHIPCRPPLSVARGCGSRSSQAARCSPRPFCAPFTCARQRGGAGRQQPVRLRGMRAHLGSQRRWRPSCCASGVAPAAAARAGRRSARAQAADCGDACAPAAGTAGPPGQAGRPPAPVRVQRCAKSGRSGRTD